LRPGDQQDQPAEQLVAVMAPDRDTSRQRQLDPLTGILLRA
jgi:hypothetical protein